MKGLIASPSLILLIRSSWIRLYDAQGNFALDNQAWVAWRYLPTSTRHGTNKQGNEKSARLRGIKIDANGGIVG